jgi:transposase-like protein
VHWPSTPIEHLQAFRPPFCPWPACPAHRPRGRSFSYSRSGFYASKRRPRVPRFRCRTCRRRFSRQTFATSYYLKRPELLLPVAASLQAGSAHRQIARTLRCAPSTVTRLSSRLGRHCLLLLARSLDQVKGRLSESVVIDHFETFEFSQDLPVGVATAVGSTSWFLYGVDPAPHRRGGTISAAQGRRLNKRPPRRTRGGYLASSRRTMRLLAALAHSTQPLEIVGDGHPAYASAARHLSRSREVVLRSYPNPNRGPKGSPRTPEAVRRDRAMFPADQLHALMRHSLAHHRRETIAFARRVNAMMERLFVAAVWRNFVKGRSERKPDPATPAMRLDLAEEAWSWRRVFSRRLFATREKVPKTWRELYRKDWTSEVLARNARHRLSRAYS